MRFKQALSRKLAAALSAVMILSTIAPTSVPVLAAAPEDVLVDSSVEYDLQDAGSEDVLLDSADSSIAEETDALEVAGEVVTNNDELLDVANEAAETGSEPAEAVEPEPNEGAGEVVKKTFTINVWDEYNDVDDYTVAWRILSGNAKRDPAAKWDGSDFLLSANKLYDFTDKLDSSAGPNVDVDNNNRVAPVDEGQIKIDVSSNNARYIRIYMLDYVGGVEVVSGNGARFDFSNTPNKYMDFDLNSTSEVNVKAERTVIGEITFAWGATPVAGDDEIIVSYDEIKSDGTKVNNKSLEVRYNSSSKYVYEIMSGNSIRITDVYFTDSAPDKSFIYNKKMAYIDADSGAAKKDIDATEPFEPTGLIKWATPGQYDFTLEFDRYLLGTTTDGGTTLSDDCIFKPDNKDGFPVLSIDKVALLDVATNCVTGTVKNGAGVDVDGYFLADSHDNAGNIEIHAHYWKEDRSVTYKYKSVKFAGAECKVDDYTETQNADNEISIQIPRKALIDAFKSGSAIAKMDLDVEKSNATVYIDPNDPASVSWHGGNKWSRLVEIRDKDNNNTWDNGLHKFVLTYGNTYTIVFEPGDTPANEKKYELVSANIAQTLVQDGKEVPDEINWWEPSQVAQLTQGVSYTAGLDPRIEIWNKKATSYVVYYDGTSATDDALKGNAGKFDVKYTKDVRIRLLQAGSQVEIVSYNAFKGTEPIYDTSIIGKNSDELLLHTEKVSNNEIRVKFAASGTNGGDIDKEADVQEITITVDSRESKTVELKNKTIANKGDKFPLGATRVYELVKKGNIDLIAVPVPNDAGIICGFADNGSLVVTTNRTAAKDYKGKIQIKDNDEPTHILCEFDIELETESVSKAKSFTAKKTGVTNNTIGLNLSVTKNISKFFTSYVKNETLESNTIDGLYYLVEATPSETPHTTALRTSYIKAFPVTGASQAEVIDLKSDTITSAQLYDGDDKITWTITVTLIQTKATSNIEKQWSSGDKKIIGSDPVTISNVKTGAGQNYATSVTLKAAGPSKKLYSNMTGDKYTVAVTYNKGCGVQMLNKVVLEDKYGDEVYTVYLGDVNTGAQDPATNQWMAPITTTALTASNTKICINPGADSVPGDHNVPAGKYVLKAYATEIGGHEVVGKMNITVLEAIEKTNTKAEADSLQIWKIPKKNATTNIKVYDQNGKAVAGSKVKFEAVDGTSTIGNVTKDLAILSSIKIAKSGKVTIDKNYTPTGTDAKNTFKVLVTANDYAGNPVQVITGAILVRAESGLGLKVENLKSSTEPVGDEKDKKNSPAYSIGSSYETSEFYYDEVKGEASAQNINDMVKAKEFAKYRYFAILTVKNNNKAGEVVNFQYGIGGAKILKFDPSWSKNHDVRGKVVIATNKPAKLTITGKALDGSKRNLSGRNKKTVDIHYSTDKIWYKLFGYDAAFKGLDYTDDDLTDMANDVYVVSSNAIDSALSGKNNGTADMPLILCVYGAKDDDKAKNDGANYTTMGQLINAKVTSRDAKVKEVKPGVWTVLPTKNQVNITIQRGSKEKVTFPFTNPAVKTKGKAVTIKATNKAFGKDNAKGKIYSFISFADGYGTAANQMAPNKVEYEVTKLDDSKTDRVRISITKDYDEQLRQVLNFGWTSAAADVYAYDQTLTNGKFTIDYKYVDGTIPAYFNVKPGTYTLSVTPGKLDSKGAFEATGKAVTLKIPTAKAPKANVKLKSTNLDFGAGGPKAHADIIFTDKNYFNDGTGVKGVTIVGLDGANTKGSISHFKTAFTYAAASDKTKYTITFQGATGCESIDPAAKDKTELSGWVGYTFRQLDGTTAPTKWIKVKIKTKGKITK